MRWYELAKKIILVFKCYKKQVLCKVLRKRQENPPQPPPPKKNMYVAKILLLVGHIFCELLMTNLCIAFVVGDTCMYFSKSCLPNVKLCMYMYMYVS